MKILKYIIFISILSSLFFVIYRQSDAKGFRRWWISLKMAVLIASILTGLVSESAEAQEFNWFENTDQQVILVGRDSSGTPSRQGQSPSNFSTPPSAGRPSRPATGTNPYIYRTPPKILVLN